mgnify:CR=1 FL=1
MYLRGAGESVPRLDCPDDPNALNIPSIACAKYYAANFGTQGMSYFTITQASHDLAFLIDELGNEPNYIQGNSFGTFWGQRYLSMYPQQVAGGVIESFDVPDRWNYFEAFNNIDWVGKRVLMYCSEDTFCNANAGNGRDPTAVMEDLLWRADEGTLPCIAKLPAQTMAPDGDWRMALETLFGSLTGAAREPYAFVPPLVRRLVRCDDDDVNAIIHLWKQQFGGSSMRNPQPLVGPKPGKMNGRDSCTLSQVVLYNLFLSEGVQSPPPPSVTDMRAAFRLQLFTGPFSVMEHARGLYDAWPRYPLDKWAHHYPNTSIPILFFNGDLDISTPWANAAYSSLTYTRQGHRLLRLPQVPHVGLLTSPVQGSPVPCGLDMATQFLASGGTLVNTTCINFLLPLDWMATSATAKAFSLSLFGTDDPWGQGSN